MVAALRARESLRLHRSPRNLFCTVLRGLCQGDRSSRARLSNGCGIVNSAVAPHGPEDSSQAPRECDDSNALTSALFDCCGPDLERIPALRMVGSPLVATGSRQ